MDRFNRWWPLFRLCSQRKKTSIPCVCRYREHKLLDKHFRPGFGVASPAGFSLFREKRLNNTWIVQQGSGGTQPCPAALTHGGTGSIHEIF